jgi:hypothetical protein
MTIDQDLDLGLGDRQVEVGLGDRQVGKLYDWDDGSIYILWTKILRKGTLPMKKTRMTD